MTAMKKAHQKSSRSKRDVRSTRRAKNTRKSSKQFQRPTDGPPTGTGTGNG